MAGWDIQGNGPYHLVTVEDLALRKIPVIPGGPAGTKQAAPGAHWQARCEDRRHAAGVVVAPHLTCPPLRVSTAWVNPSQPQANFPKHTPGMILARTCVPAAISIPPGAGVRLTMTAMCEERQCPRTKRLPRRGTRARRWLG